MGREKPNCILLSAKHGEESADIRCDSAFQRKIGVEMPNVIPPAPEASEAKEYSQRLREIGDMTACARKTRSRKKEKARDAVQQKPTLRYWKQGKEAGSTQDDVLRPALNEEHGQRVKAPCPSPIVKPPQKRQKKQAAESRVQQRRISGPVVVASSVLVSVAVSCVTSLAVLSGCDLTVARAALVSAASTLGLR